MSKTIKELAQMVDKFCKDRNWKNSDPNQLLTSTYIELGELAEHYQWQNKFKELTEEEKKEIGYEFVDVFFYLLRLASNSGIDVAKSFEEKVPKLEKKFPVGQTKEEHNKVHKEYRAEGKNKTYD